MTGIGSSAFAECSLLEAIDLPGTVTELGGKAFYSSGLKEYRPARRHRQGPRQRF